VRIDEPGADLAIALAIASATKGAPVQDGLAAFGELGLTGRLRAAAQAERRLEECAKLGLTAVLAPRGTSRVRGVAVIEAGSAVQALGLALGEAAAHRD
jgi:DNA repair protein RadA/Sms